jgi:hypothetical protein
VKKAELNWDEEARKYIDKAPFFVRGFARKKVEKAATENGVSLITKEFVEKIRQKES